MTSAANGSTVISTPHIDELAANGVRLTDGYVSAAVCSPMRAGVFTGRYQNRFGYEYNPTANYERNADAELGLPEDETTLGDMMREAGYVTGLVGKWHLGFREQYHPLKRGFDEFFGHLGGGSSYVDPNDPDAHRWPSSEPAATEPGATGWTPVVGDRGDGPRAIMDGYEVVEVDEYLTDVFADRAVSFIERHADEPFFLMLAPNAPHTPIQATSKYVDRYAHIEEPGARIYAAMVSSVDDMVGPRHRDAPGTGTGGEHARRLHLRQRLHQLHAGGSSARTRRSPAASATTWTAASGCRTWSSGRRVCPGARSTASLRASSTCTRRWPRRPGRTRVPRTA